MSSFLPETFFWRNFKNRAFNDLTVAPGEDVKVEDTWFFFIVLSVSGGQGE